MRPLAWKTTQFVARLTHHPPQWPHSRFLLLNTDFFFVRPLPLSLSLSPEQPFKKAMFYSSQSLPHLPKSVLISVVLIKTCRRINTQIITLRFSTYIAVGCLFNPAKFLSNWLSWIMNLQKKKKKNWTFIHTASRRRNNREKPGMSTFKCKNQNLTTI